jgi:hypothetical protein
VHVIEATCEVVGTSSPTLFDQPSSVLPTLRADWSTYISPSSQTTGIHLATLLSQLKWAHQGEYDRGLSRAWLTRTINEGYAGAEKRRIAERYVLACVVSNRLASIDFAQNMQSDFL